MTKLQSLLLVLIFFFSTCSQASENTTSGWLGTFTKKDLSEKYSFWAETQLRYSIEDGGTNQLLYRFGLLRTLNNEHEIGFLYAFIQSSQLKEHRLTLQHSQKYGEWGGFNFSSRARLEARFLEDSDDDASRFRFLIRKERSLNSDCSFVSWNEIFINITDDAWTGQRTFERNRLFVGLKSSVLNSKVEFGYLNQFVPRVSMDVFEHTLVAYLFF